MKLVTAARMREIEERCVKSGLPTDKLMENAGLAVALEMKKRLGEVRGKNILVLVGPGNNGGDGLVAARHLHSWGALVCLYLSSPRSDGNYKITQEKGIPSHLATQDRDLSHLKGWLPSAEVVLDALFGTGKTRPLEGAPREILEMVRQERGARKLFLLALDLPSGLNPDTGAADPACLASDLTITLGYAKPGLFTFPGAEKAGEVVVADIGIPPSLGDEIRTELITSQWAKSVLPRRLKEANKGTFGKVLVVAGSINYIGAAYLACTGAARVGVGLVTLATPRSLQPILAAKLTEVTYAPLPESEPGVLAPTAASELSDWLPKYDVLLLGCGLGQSQGARGLVESLFLDGKLKAPPALILDADALNALAQIPRWWEKLPQDAILTPHPGEMARLRGRPDRIGVEEVQSDRLGVALEAAALWHKTLVLKGAYTVVASPSGEAKICPVANPGLASAGTGDVLAGAIAGLVAQGLALFPAAALGVFLHAQAGEFVKAELGDTGMLASDLLPALPRVIKNLKET